MAEVKMWCDSCGRHGNEEDGISVGEGCVDEECGGIIHVDVEWLDARTTAINERITSIT